MTALYELTDQIKELNEISENPEMHDSVKNTLDCIEMEFREKANNIALLLKNKDSDLIQIQSEIDRLSVKKKCIKNFQSNLKEYLRSNMEASEIKSLSFPLFSISLIKGRDVVAIDDEEAIPDEFVNVKITTSPIKNEIIKFLKDGVKISGTHLEKSKSSIKIG